jgi:hypothetical protein
MRLSKTIQKRAIPTRTVESVSVALLRVRPFCGTNAADAIGACSGNTTDNPVDA